MKKTIICIALAALWGGTALQAQRTVTLPPVLMSNNRSVEVSRVTLTDTATILDIAAAGRPMSWMTIAAGTHLKVGDRQYAVRHGEGIELDSMFHLSEAGEGSFRLIFEPLPKNTARFDFSEGDCKTCFNMWGIELENKRLAVAIPEAYTRQHTPETGFTAGWQPGEARLSGQVLGYRPEVGDLTLEYVNIISQERQEMPVKVAADGSFSTAVHVFGPTNVTLYLTVSSIPVVVAPGQEAKVLVNLPEMTRAGSRLHKETPSYGRPYYYDGYLASLNTALADERLKHSPETSADLVAGMDINQYKSYLSRLVNEAIAHNNGLDIDPLAKSLANANLQFQVASILPYADQYLIDAYAKKNGASYQEASKAYVPTAKEASFYDFYNNLPHDANVSLLPNIAYYIGGLLHARNSEAETVAVMRHLASQSQLSDDERSVLNGYLEAQAQGKSYDRQADVRAIYTKHKAIADNYLKDKSGEALLTRLWGTDQTFLHPLIKARRLSNQLKDFTPLTAEQKKSLDLLPATLRDAIVQMDTDLHAKIEANRSKTGYTVMETPNVGNEQLLDEMLKPFRGKVALVDFWATWCGPCRQANKQMEPLKAQLADKEVVYVYITGTTSPENTWRNMIPDLHGSHYRLSGPQWDALCAQVKAEGVPTYLIVDREGKQTFQSVGFPGAETVKRELQNALGNR